MEHQLPRLPTSFIGGRSNQIPCHFQLEFRFDNCLHLYSLSIDICFHQKYHKNNNCEILSSIMANDIDATKVRNYTLLSPSRNKISKSKGIHLNYWPD